MFHHSPTLTYQGLTIIVSQASRFDTTKLLSGNSGEWFNGECIRPGMNKLQCDIWDVEAFNRGDRTLHEGTKCVLLLGQKAHREIGNQTTILNEHRGSPFIINGIPYLSSYLYQDTFDLKDYETRLNPLLNGELESDGDDTDSDSDKASDARTEKSRHGKTARSNWRFWLQRDTKKAVRIARGGLQLPVEPTYNIYPSSTEVIEVLNSYENTELFLDIETDSDLNITCFGFSFGKDSIVYVVPIINYSYVLCYDNLGMVLRSLARAMAKNTLVAHNGSGFDFIVFPFKYRLPYGKSFADSLVMHHRCFPEVEKSLGHCISNFTDLPYHKDEGVFEPQNEAQQQALWRYNGKDVFAMREVYYAILNYADRQQGLRVSIDQANASIRPYVTAILTGMRYRTDIIADTIARNDKRMRHLLRMLEAAVGAETLKEIRGKGKSSMPSSSTQCVKYFHGICGYPVVGYGKPGIKDGKRKPSLNEKNFYKLALKVTNPVVDIVLAYRGLAKESSMLKFNNWPTMPGLCK